MESNGIPSGMFPGMLGLQMSLHHHPQPPLQNPQNTNNNSSSNNNNNHLQENRPMVAFGAHGQTPKQQGNANPFAQKARTQHLLTFSDENDDESEPAGTTVDDRKSSPWHRMKWSDEMVRLLITVVFYVGDDAVGSEGSDAAAVARKKVAGVMLQKKGKWKSVSAAMMEKGYYVSPQQCEDKFNDLNKRYKRVNELLGRGTACKVVENQNLLEGMDHLSSKMKEEVKKLLNSKHLYFREMCAFHNTCGGGGGGGGSQQVSAEAAAESSPPSRQKKGCLHLPESTSNYVTNLSRTETNGSKMALEESDDDDDDDEVVEGGAHNIHEYDTDDKTTRKKARKERFDLESPSVEEFSRELKNLEEEGTKSVWEKRQWMRMRLIQLGEQGLKYQRQSFELEKERMKWLKFCSNKEKEMEVEKLGNQRMKIENERMLLFLRQKEQDLHDDLQ